MIFFLGKTDCIHLTNWLRTPDICSIFHLRVFSLSGIITNYKDIQQFLIQKGHKFESETDTEIIAKLIRHMHQYHPHYTFLELVEGVIQQLVSLQFSPRAFTK